MKITAECPGCQARYHIPEDAIPDQGRRVACAKCGQKWTVQPPGAGSPPPSPKAAPGPSATPPPPPATAAIEETTAVAPAALATAETSKEAGGILCCPHCGFNFEASSAKPFQKEGRTVLIVEDQDFFRNLIRESLGDGYNYLMAASVEQAQSILGCVDVDLVMLDLTLQEPYDGEKVLDSAGGKVPILVLTGDQDPDLYGEKWNDYQARGATDLIIKGLTIREQIAIKVNAILNEGQAPWTG